MKAYDERNALRDYIMRHAKHYMSEFERRCIRLGILREKASESESAHIHDLFRDAWSREGDDLVEQALVAGVVQYQMQIRERLLRECDAGTVLVNRCPKCSRIARTPLAKQCRWCGHDWHGS
jgi:hypothetical protein